MSKTYLKHVNRIAEIKQNDTRLVEIWECVCNEMTETNQKL